MDIIEKLQILTDAAKYDVSCSSSNSSRKNKGGLGSADPAGICHSWSEDGRCISLLKILFTNKCIYNCDYCINRRENLQKRAEFSPEEVAYLTINFYKRNYIEGLFLSSGVIRSPDYTMERLIEVAKILRFKENFNGYIHMKSIPGCSEELIKELGNLVDRMSINIELPTSRSLALLAPDKSYNKILSPMKYISEESEKNISDRRKYKNAPKFVRAGQTTQMIVGAADESDLTIIDRAEKLYNAFKMKRVYYSAFIPVSTSTLTAKIKTPPLLREHRIYQADFLMRFYGFHSNDLLDLSNPYFDLKLDPKINWAIEHIERFPIEINRATYEELLKVPGFGRTYAKRIINSRKFAALSYDDLRLLKISTKRAANFITVGGVYRGINFSSKEGLKFHLKDNNGFVQMDFLGGRDELYI
ncbi:putative DNA modification/repair radical SAM protein [Peptoniphilus catoniae]|uniref:putative DNA modification/repair radical SAM protein n=1 Tax=Peptoniphilus catoniae TaxID=1660341 RepID=UPI0010FDD0F7|nr:putative DNA modification/repair radical SAM protein [Peptoniphilus catoniae]